ncbi:MAG: hypothetical protein Q9208_006969 [Pyrenodesmia sp. 3 TL-2023]
MSSRKTLKLSHLPDDLSVYVELYDAVKNAAFLQEQLLEGNMAFEYAFIDASVILSSTHILAAVFRAANDWLNGRLRSKNVHSEIVFCLSMNNNIAESFRRFGISPATTALYAIKVSRTSSISAATVGQHLSDSIEGTSLPFQEAEISKFTDITKVRKIYKLAGPGKSSDKASGNARDGRREEHEGASLVTEDGRKRKIEKRELEKMVLGLMALRGAT